MSRAPFIAMFAASLITCGGAFAAPAGRAAIDRPETQDYGPANDDFARAEVLAVGPYLAPGDLRYTSRELNEPKIAASSRGRTVWYRYTATATGRMVVAVSKAYYKAPFQLAVYSGTALTNLKRLGAVQVVGSDTDYSGAVGFNAAKGTTYYVQVDVAPNSNGFVGKFLIGLQAVGATGQIGAFINNAMTFQENSFDSDKEVIVANGHTSTISLTYGLSKLNNAISTTPSRTTLTPGQTSIFTFYDEYQKFPDGSQVVGSLDLIAKATSNNSILGGYTLPIRLLTTEYTNRPDLQVRFADPKPGVAVSGRATSYVYVRNRSNSPATGCRFETEQYYNAAVSTFFAEKLSNGSFGPANAPFAMAAKSARVFLVNTRISSNEYYRNVFLKCVNSNGTVTSNDSSYFEPTAYYGINGNILVRPESINAFGEVSLPDFGTKRIYVSLANPGPYSGYFAIYANDDTYEDRAVITSMCLVNSSNACIGPASTSYVEFDAAKGETRRIAVDVRRGSSTSSGEIELFAHAIDYSNYDVVGYGAFTLKK